MTRHETGRLGPTAPRQGGNSHASAGESPALLGGDGRKVVTLSGRRPRGQRVPFVPTGKKPQHGLQFVQSVPAVWSRRDYYTQSQSDDVLALLYEPRLVDGVERLCLVGASLIDEGGAR